MKMHWGHGIALFYFLFVFTLVLVVIESTGFDNSLVTEEYYARDINYQQEYERRSNSQSLEEGPRLSAADRSFRLDFPDDLAEGASGTVHFYRPSGKSHDRLVELRLDDRGGMDLPVEGLLPGRYLAIVEWTAHGVGYYDEFDLTV